jgi:class 3 adenylate cyclase
MSRSTKSGSGSEHGSFGRGKSTRNDEVAEIRPAEPEYSRQALLESLATLGDVTEEEEIFHLFQLLAIPPTMSTVATEHAFLILEVIGLPMEGASFDEIVGDQPDLTYDQVRDVAQQLRVLCASGKDEQQAVHERETEIIHLGLVSYCWKRLTCQKPPQGAEFRFVPPSIEVKPRHVLISSMALVTFLCNSLMVMTVALLWVSLANKVEVDIMTVFGDTTSTFITSFENVMMSANGDELRRTGTLISGLGDALYHEFTERALRRTSREARLLALGVDITGDALLAADLAIAKMVTARLPRLVEATLFARAVKAVNTVLPSVARASFMNASSGRMIAGSDSTCVSACDSVYSCLNVTDVTSGSFTHYLQDPSGGGLASTLTTAFGEVVQCTSVPVLASKEAAQEKIVGVAMDLLESRVGQRSSLPLWAAQVSGTRVTYVAGAIPTTSAPCPEGSQCDGQDAMVRRAFTSQTPQSGNTYDRDARAVLTSNSPTRYRVLIGGSTMETHLRETFVTESFIPNIENLNYIRVVQQGSTIEVTYMDRDPNTGIIHQASAPALSGQYGPRDRPPAGLVNAFNGYAQRGSGWSITPDYRPEPVVGGYSYDPEGTLAIVIVVERDVPEVRRIAMNSLVELVEAINSESRQSLELLLVHPRGELLTETYDPNQLCPVDVSCVTYDGFGIVYRSDCSHCTRQVVAPVRSIAYLAVPKLIDDCRQRFGSCDEDFLSNDRSSFVWSAMNRVPAAAPEVDLSTTDYRGVSIIGYSSHIANFSTTFIAKQDRSDVFDGIQEYIMISGLSCGGIILVITVVFVLLARRVLEKIELEWMQYKSLIAEERTAFTNSVKDLMPAYLAERITQNHQIQGEHANLCIAFVDVKGGAKRCEGYEPEDLARFNTYVLHMLDTFAIHYRIHRVRFIGDLSIYVSGLNEATGENHGDHFTVRMLRFLSNVIQVTGMRYAHYPHRCDLIASKFGSEAYCMPDVVGEPQHVGCIRLAPCAIGIHQGGTTVSLALSETGAPQFDVLGPAVSLTNRLCQTAKENTIVVSDTVRDSIERHAPADMFQFGKQRKVVLRGRGTASTFEVKLASVPMATSLLTTLGIRYARLRKYFDENDERQAVRESHSSEGSMRSRSDAVGSIKSNT